jgi:hypothetical protein
MAKEKAAGSGQIRTVRVVGGEDVATKEMAFEAQDLWVVGKGFRDGEVVLSFDSEDGMSMGTRMSAMAVDGEFRFQPPLTGRVNDFVITAYVPDDDGSMAEAAKTKVAVTHSP